MSGLTDAGFEIKRLSEIKEELEADFRAAFPGVTVLPDSVVGQIIGIMAKKLSDLWQVAELVYLSQYPASSEGFSLDNVAQLTGIVRLEATQTEVEAILEGVQGTVVPDGTQASVIETGKIFSQVDSVTITKDSVLKCVVSVSDVQSLTSYQVGINGTGYTYNSDADATAEEISAGLVSAINIGSADVTATDNADGTFNIQIDDKTTPFAVDVDARLTLDEIWIPALYRAMDTGLITCNAGTLIIIETPVSGLNSIDNLLDGDLGRELETDEDLRIRRIQSLSIAAAATTEAIKARILQEVPSVLSCKIFENRTDITDGSGRPPHSFEAVVSGGTDQNVGNKIWEVKAAGIATYGNTSVNVTDSEGDIQVMKFSRPTSKYAWVDVVITTNPEEDFPVDGLQQIKNAILAFGTENYSVGDDFIIQKLFKPIYDVQGVASATVQIAITDNPGDIPVYSSSNISIGEVAVLVFDAARITVA